MDSRLIWLAGNREGAAVSDLDAAAPSRAHARARTGDGPSRGRQQNDQDQDDREPCVLVPHALLLPPLSPKERERLDDRTAILRERVELSGEIFVAPTEV